MIAISQTYTGITNTNTHQMYDDYYRIKKKIRDTGTKNGFLLFHLIKSHATHTMFFGFTFYYMYLYVYIVINLFGRKKIVVKNVVRCPEINP